MHGGVNIKEKQEGFITWILEMKTLALINNWAPPTLTLQNLGHKQRTCVRKSDEMAKKKNTKGCKVEAIDEWKRECWNYATGSLSREIVLYRQQECMSQIEQ